MPAYSKKNYLLLLLRMKHERNAVLRWLRSWGLSLLMACCVTLSVSGSVSASEQTYSGPIVNILQCAGCCLYYVVHLVISQYL